MTNEELDVARAKKAAEIWDPSNGTLAITAARLAREGWMPPVPVDPDIAEARNYAKSLFGTLFEMPNPQKAEELFLRALKQGRALVAAEAQPSVDEIASRFLQWKLPSDFGPDGGISFSKGSLPPNPFYWPTGTNLLTYRQAAEMARFILNLPEDVA